MVKNAGQEEDSEWSAGASEHRLTRGGVSIYSWSSRSTEYYSDTFMRIILLFYTINLQSIPRSFDKLKRPGLSAASDWPIGSWCYGGVLGVDSTWIAFMTSGDREATFWLILKCNGTELWCWVLGVGCWVVQVF